MALTYDIEGDIRYQQGFKVGFKIGYEEVRLEYTTSVVKSMLESSEFTTEQIMRYVKVSKEFVEKIAKELKK